MLNKSIDVFREQQDGASGAAGFCADRFFAEARARDEEQQWLGWDTWVYLESHL